MKRISPILFLTLASAMVVSDQTSFAQSQSSDLAPGPIAEMLPKFDTPAAAGFDYLDSEPEPNRLPTSKRQSRQVDKNSFQLPEKNALPTTDHQKSSIVEPPAANSALFDTPAQSRSTSAQINSPPPSMPSPPAATLPRTPGGFYPGSAPVSTSQFPTGQAPVYSGVETILAPTPAGQPCNCQSPMVISEGDYGCDSCGEGEIFSTGDCDTCGEGEIFSTGDCDTCGSSDEVFFVDGEGCQSYDDCGSTEWSQSEVGFYDTGADRIADTSPRHSNRRRGHKGIFGRHRAKHLAKKERRARLSQADERLYEEDQYAAYQDEGAYYQDQASDVGDNYGAAPVVAPVNHGQGDGATINTTIGVNGLYFNRDYEDDRQFSASRFANERGLFSNDADEDDFGGYEVNLTRRKSNGNGFEARFFELEPSRATATLSGGPFTTLSAASFNDPAIFLSGVGVPNVNFGGGFVQDVTAAEVFNFADVHQVSRETSIDNVEFNLLRLGRTGQRKRGVGRLASHEYLVGFRYLRFDESFRYSAFGFRPGNIASDLSRADYLNEVTNSLYGAQIGGRTEIGFLKRFSVIVGTKAGIFNNNFTNNQDVTFSPRGASRITAQVLDGPSSGQAFDTEGEDSQIGMIGELDLGVTYRMFRNSRLRVGYRALFVQTETFFSDLNAVQSPSDNDSLFLQGGYFGAEFAF